MDLTTMIVVIAGTALFFGFAIFMAFYSRSQEGTDEQSKAE